MSKHTPGPWQIIEDGNNEIDEIVDLWLRTVCFVEHNRQNSILIAAAPELLEEAEKLIDLHAKAINGEQSDLVQWDSAVLNLRSAIAKAKGEQG